VTAAALALVLAASPAAPIDVLHAPGALHGFPSMSDEAGEVIADGELSQQRRRSRLTVRLRWEFADGLVVEERDVFRVGRTLEQRRFSWVETREGVEQRAFEVDLRTGRAEARVRRDGELERERAQLELPAGRAFAGYGIGLAAAELPLRVEGDEAEITVVAFTPGPRAVAVKVRRGGPERIDAAGRPIPCVRYTLRPQVPAIAKLFVKVEDSHLWFTQTAPRGLVRAAQNLVAKDDPRVVVDVIPRGPARRAAAER
jgi:hypothetical protein